MRKLVFHDLGVYFKLFQNEAKNIADLFAIKREFDKTGNFAHFPYTKNENEIPLYQEWTVDE